MGAIYTVEIQAHTGAGVETFYVASGELNTGASDVPAHQHFQVTLQTPANFERALYSSGSTSGASSIGFGEIVIVNAHGRYDAWPDYAFDGRPCIVKAIPINDFDGRPLWAYKDAPVLIRGTVDSIDITDAFSTIRIRIYDRLSDLDKPLLTARYGGTTLAGGQGADGTVDLKDTIKPAVYGRKLNVPPITVNPFDLVYQVSLRACSSIVAYDGGLALTNAGDFSSVAALLAAALTPGQYGTCLALGLFRLGGSPVSTITADVVGVGSSTAAGIVRQMLLDFGVSAGELNGASFDALDAKNPAACGVFVNGDGSVLSYISQVLSSVGGWIVPDGLGVFSVGRLDLPTGNPVARFDEWQARGKLERIAPGDSNRGIPAYRVIVRYGQLGQTQAESDVAGAVSADRRAALAIEWREAAAQDDTIKARHLLAQEMTFDTCLLNAADALAEAQRLLAIYGGRRDVWRIRVDIADLDYRYDQNLGDPFTLTIGLGSEVQLSASRFLTPPKNFIVIGRVEDCEKNSIQFDLWG